MVPRSISGSRRAEINPQPARRLARVRARFLLAFLALLLTSFAGTRLRMELDKIPLWRGDHVSIPQLQEDFARYLYLPRLQKPIVLAEAVRNGLGLLTWEQDSFAYADSIDEQAGRYRGLQVGRALAIGDGDRGLLVRPEAARPIAAWDVQRDFIVRPPKGTTHVVLDTPAGLRGLQLKDALRLADRVLVPLQPSIFDIYATREFIDELRELKGAGPQHIGLVGMRVDERTLAAEQLRQFTDDLGLPVLAQLRPTQNYVHLAARGLTLFDVAPGRVQRDLEQWQGLCRWLDQSHA